MNKADEDMNMRFGARGAARTAEMVTNGHPDKFCDQVADAILDCAVQSDSKSRVAIECLAKESLLIVSGEITTTAILDIEAIARNVWEDKIGYGPGKDLIVLAYVKQQSKDISRGAGNDQDGGVDFGGAGDQGIMIGYASSETVEMMPREYELARKLCLGLKDLRQSGELPWLRPDGKSQVTISEGQVTSVILAAHHEAGIAKEDVRRELRRKLVEPVIGDVERVVINGTGSFIEGGPHADAGVVGRKIVADAYGPRVPVGGGAFSGKDPTKVDRSAAYMARYIAKAIVAHRIADANECLVALAYGIGQPQPEMITAITDAGKELREWVKNHFPDLSQPAIIERLGLLSLNGWSYADAAAFGHFGRDGFPWEEVAVI